MASYPGEFAQLGDITSKYVFLHWGDGDHLDYWTFAKFIMRSYFHTIKANQGSSYLSSDSYNRWIGNDGSTYLNGLTIYEFTGGYDGGQTYLKFYGNNIHDGGVTVRGERGEWSSYGIYIAGYGTHDDLDIGWNEISYLCEARGIQVFGHKVDDWVDNLKIHDNYIHHCSYQGAVLGGGDGPVEVDYDFLKNVWFYNNILAFNGNTDWIEPDTCGTKRGCFFNLFINGGLSGGRGGNGNYYIYNNVLYKTDNHEIRIQGDSNLIEIKNNIIWASPGKDYYISVGDRWDTMVLSNNCYYGGDDGIPAIDVDSIEQDPLFVDPDQYDNPGNADFHLQAGSPCRDIGDSSISAIVPLDFFGVARPRGATYDIGVDEYDAGDVPNELPQITDITATPTSGQAPLSVDFTVTANDPDGVIASYAWDFGDDGTSALQNPTHVYASPGTYVARVTVTDDDDATASDTIEVVVSAAGNLPPVISNVTAEPSEGEAPLTVDFTVTASDPDGVIVSYDWDFGDGDTSTDQNPTHTYTSSGEYTATVVVTDDGAATDSETVDITVTEVGDEPPVISSISASPSSGNAPLTVDFTVEASHPDGDPLSYSWDFGDGNTSTDQNPTHTFAAPPPAARPLFEAVTPTAITVTVTVTHSNTLSDSETVVVTVTFSENLPPVITDVSATPSSGDVPLAVYFSITANDPEGGDLSYFWDFGDGNNSAEEDPSHTYTSSGNYNVTVTVTDGESSSTEDTSITIAASDPSISDLAALRKFGYLLYHGSKPKKAFATLLAATPMIGSYIDSDYANVEDYSDVALLFALTKGSITSMECIVWHSLTGEDGSWFREGEEEPDGDTTTDSAPDRQFTPSGNVNYFLFVPVVAKYLKVQVKATGTLTGNSIQIFGVGLK
jgi:PKD repeat protein